MRFYPNLMGLLGGLIHSRCVHNLSHKSSFHSVSLILSSAKTRRICSVFYRVLLLFSTLFPGFNTPETRTNKRNSGVWRHVKKETDESRTGHAEKYETCQGCKESAYPLINPPYLLHVWGSFQINIESVFQLITL